jgi:GT2 family glycosyltransferase
MADTAFDRLAIVAIGRNEGERLRRCLQSVHGRAGLVVYVDSGSTDGSIESARARGVEVVNLDAALPFTAARARNAGWRRAVERNPGLKYLQFVDGDCKVCADWLEVAVEFMEIRSDLAAVCGQRRERFPNASIYNRLCDMEWRRPAGPIAAFGGDVLMRASALADVGGYRDDLIAGEEPELCVRLRRAGWGVHALENDMTVHDAAMTRFAQWWIRTRRSGYAFAQGSFLHGKSPERHKVRESRRAWLWGLWLPAGICLAGLFWRPIAFWLLSIYPFQAARLSFAIEGAMRDRVLVGVLRTLGRFPELLGQLQFMRDRLLRRQARLLEYK